MSAGAVAIVVVVVVLLNILVKSLPEKRHQIDLSGNSLYTLSDVSKTYLDNLNYDVELIIVAEKDNVDARVTKLLDNYVAYSDHLTLTTVDPVQNPTILDEYDNISANSLVVKCEETGRHTIVPFQGTENSLIIYTYDSSAQTYVESAFDAEGQVTKAVNYCVTDASETVYTLSGHGESDFYSGMTDLLNKSSVAVKSRNLLTDGGIPDDCSMLLCYQPTADLADDELKMIRDYMQTGGHVMLFIDESNLTNFNALLTEYGLHLEDGYIAETANGKYYQNYYYVFSEVDSENSSVPAKSSGDYMVLAPFSRGRSKVDPRAARSTLIASCTAHSGTLLPKAARRTEAILLPQTAPRPMRTEMSGASLPFTPAPPIISSNVLSNFSNLETKALCFSPLSAILKTSAASISPQRIELPLQFHHPTRFFSILFVACDTHYSSESAA